MNKYFINKKIKWAYAAALFIVIVLVFVTYNNLNYVFTDAKKDRLIVDERSVLENTLSHVRSLDSGLNIFNIISSENLLAPYYRGVAGIKRDISRFNNIIYQKDGDQKQQWINLETIIKQKRDYSIEEIEILRLKKYDTISNILLTKLNIELTDNIENKVNYLINYNRVITREASEKRKSFAKNISYQFFILAFLFLFILGFLYFIMHRDFKKIVEADVKLKFNASLIRNISDPIITTDSDNKITNWNLYAEQLYGYKEGEVLGKDADTIFKIKNVDESLVNLRKVDSSEDFWKGELTHEHKKGHTLFTEATYSAIIDESGKKIGTVSVIRDITARKNTEKILQRLTTNLEKEVKIKAAELNTVFERITDAFIALDNDWNYTYANKKSAELHYRPIDGLVGRNIWEEYPDLVNEPFYEALHLAKQTGEPQRLELFYSKTNTWFEDLIYPSPDGISVYYHDITDKKNAAIILQQAHEKLSYHINNTPLGVVEFNMNLQIIQWSKRACEIFGWTKEELIEQENVVDALVYKDDIAIVRQAIINIVEKKYDNGVIQIRNKNKKGQVIYCEWYNSVLKDAKGNVTGLIAMVHDITNRKEIQKELEDSNERFNLVAKATNDAVWDWNIEENKIWGNEVFSQLYNIPLGTEISYEVFVQKQHPHDKIAIDENLRQAIRQKQSLVTKQFRFLLNEKDTLILNNRANIIYDNKGNPIRMLGAMQDITPQINNEQQIILEKELSDSIINSLPGIFYLYNKKGDFYRWNTNFLKVTGYTIEELKNLSLINLFSKEQHADVIAKVKNVFSKGEDFVEAFLLNKDGEKIPYYFTGRIIQYEGESCLMGVGIDISERVKSQQELAQSEERYRTIIEQASDGIFISDLSGKYLDVNTNGVRLSGYTKDELLNLSVYDLIPVEDIDKNPVKFQEILTGNVAINERVLKRKDGSLREIEVSAKLLADGRYLGIVRDITTRKRAQEALRLSEEKYRLLFNQNPMPMFMVELPDRKFIDVNIAAIDFYGYNKEEFLRMTSNDIRPDYAAYELKDFDFTNETGVHNAGIWDHKKNDGTIVRVNIIAHNILYEGKDVRLVLANDVTEKVKAEEELIKSHEALRQLATHLEKVRETERTLIAREIHDELGQQLTGLKMDISWLNRRLKNQDAEVQQKITETILLIDTTVKTVRRIATELRPSILDDLGLLAAMEWQSEEFEKRFEIACIFGSNVTDVKINPDQATGVFRIYQESLTNVLRHAEATEVIVNLQIKDQTLVLTIRDNGKGFIAKEIENKKTLGLLGMKERTTLMGGTYEISSQPGEGVSVIIVVPLKNN